MKTRALEASGESPGDRISVCLTCLGRFGRISTCFHVAEALKIWKTGLTWTLQGAQSRENKYVGVTWGDAWGPLVSKKHWLRLDETIETHVAANMLKTCVKSPPQGAQTREMLKTRGK